MNAHVRLVSLTTTVPAVGDEWRTRLHVESCPGAINLANRALPCLPSALFEIHLGITPEPLKLVPVEPPITTATTDDLAASRRRNGADNGPSWYEAQDLEVLKAWSNEIVEIQPEISMFGSLKTIDVCRVCTVMSMFADLCLLVAQQQTDPTS